MAIASNIFKHLLYVPEGATIGKVDPDSIASQNTGAKTLNANAAKGDDEIVIQYTSSAGTKINKGSLITIGTSTQRYYLVNEIDTASGSSATAKLDRPLVADATSGTSIVTDFNAPNKPNQPRSLRRVSSNLDAQFETYSSAEINAHQQLNDVRIGSKTVTGTISGELSSYTYDDFFGAMLRKEFYSPIEQSFAGAVTVSNPASTSAWGGVVSSTLSTSNVAVLTFVGGDLGSVSGDAGSTADKVAGIRVGDVIRITSGNYQPSLSGVAVAFNTMSFLVIDKDISNASAPKLAIVAANSPETVSFAAGTVNAGAKVQVLGRKSFVPMTGHKKMSFQFEHFFSDLSDGVNNAGQPPVSDLFTGCRISNAAVKLPVSGIATVDFSIMGINARTASETIRNYQDNADVQPADFIAANTVPMMQTLSGEAPRNAGIDALYTSSVGNIYYKLNGQLYKADAITGFDFTMDGANQTLKVIGSTSSPDVTVGKISVTGNMSVYFKDNILRNAFVNSNEFTMIAFFSETADNTLNSAFMNFTFPRVKLTGASKDDAESITMNMPFQALLSDGANGAEATTIQIQTYAQPAG